MYTVVCYERNTGFGYCRPATFTAKHKAMRFASQCARDTAGNTGYDVKLAQPDCYGDMTDILFHWRDGKRVDP